MDSEEARQHNTQIAKGSFFGIVGSMAFKIVSLLYLVLVARAVSQEDVGLFSLAFAVVSFLEIMTNLGLPASLSRYLPYFDGRGDAGKSKYLIKLSCALLIPTSALFSVALWLGAGASASIYPDIPRLPEAIRLLSSFIFFGALFQLNVGYLKGRADMRSLQWLQNLQNVLKLALSLIFFVAFSPSIEALCYAFVLSYPLSMLLAFPAAYRKEKSLPGGQCSIRAAEMLGEVLPFGLALSVVASIWAVLMYSDRLLLGYMLPPSDAVILVASYSFATTMASAITMFPVSVGNIFLPVTARLVGKQDMSQISGVMGTAQRWILFITMPFALVMVVFSEELIGIVYGKDYVSGAAAMSIFTVGLVLQALSIPITLLISAMRAVKLQLAIAFVTAAANVILCILLIPGYGIAGAAAASALSFALMALILAWHSARAFSFVFPLSTYKIALAAILVFLVMSLMHGSVSGAAQYLPQFGEGELGAYASKLVYVGYIGAMVLLCGGLFMLTALLLKCFQREDVVLMKKAMLRARIPQPLADFAEHVASRGVPDGHAAPPE